MIFVSSAAGPHSICPYKNERNRGDTPKKKEKNREFNLKFMRKQNYLKINVRNIKRLRELEREHSLKK